VLLCGGLALGSVGAWLAAIGRAETSPDPLPFAAAVAATAGTALAAVALGLLIGTTLPTVPATLLAVAVSIPLVAAAFLVAAELASAPGRGPRPAHPH